MTKTEELVSNATPPVEEADVQNIKGSKSPSIYDVCSKMEEMKLSIGYNEMASSISKTGATEWDYSARERQWDERDDSELFALLEDRLGLHSEKVFRNALTIYAYRHTYNPLIAKLKSIKWDGKPRIGTLFNKYLGAVSDEYAQAVESLYFCGGIGRAFNPGCKYDYCITLVGPGGIGKSTFIRRSALNDSYFCDSVYDLGNVKATGEVLRGKWLIELSELTGISGRSLEAVKAGITRQVDTFRVAYGKHTHDFQRRSVFVATTNTIGFISEKSSGARRFLPVQCDVVKTKASVHSTEFIKDVEQAWAEALVWMTENDSRFALSLSPEMEIMAAQMREGFIEEDPRVDAIRSYLSSIEVQKRLVCTYELTDNALRCERSTKLSRDISAILTDQCPGWKVAGKRQCGVVNGVNYGKQLCWEYVGK